MTIETAVKIKDGTPVYWKGRLAEVVWTESVSEKVCIVDKEQKYSKHNAIAIRFADNTTLTYRSQWPFPQNVEITELTLI